MRCSAPCPMTAMRRRRARGSIDTGASVTLSTSTEGLFNCASTSDDNIFGS